MYELVGNTESVALAFPYEDWYSYKDRILKALGKDLDKPTWVKPLEEVGYNLKPIIVTK